VVKNTINVNKCKLSNQISKLHDVTLHITITDVTKITYCPL